MPKPPASPIHRPTPSPSGTTDTGPGPTPETPSKPTGTEPGKTGSIVKLPTVPLAEAMAGMDPQATAASLTAALPDSFAGALDPIVRRTFPPSGGVNREFLGFKLLRPIADQDRSSALTLVKRSLSPMAQDELTRLLVAMRAMTRTKAETAELVDLQLEVYAQKLTEWPADVVRALLCRWPEQNSFWPTWHECLTFMDPLTRKRRALLEVLEADA